MGRRRRKKGSGGGLGMVCARLGFKGKMERRGLGAAEKREAIGCG
jgi:hypothetical protein